MNSEAQIRQLLEGGIDALEDGDAVGAQALLARMLRLSPRDEWGWYYLSWTMNTAPGIAWCLDRVLTINPNQPHAKERLRKVGESAGWSIASVRMRPVQSAERLLDAQELPLQALGAGPHCADMELDGLRSQVRSLDEELQAAQAATARLGSDAQLAIQAQQVLACELDELLADTARAIARLDSIERRSAAAEVKATQTDEMAEDSVTRGGSLGRKVTSPSAMFQAVRAGLGRLDGRFARTGRAVAGRERRSAARLEERACALRSRLRWAALSVLAILFD